MKKTVLVAAASLTLAACGDRADDARGVDHGETLLSVSASGQAESRPDRAQFNAGIETFSRSAKAASEANAEKIEEILQNGAGEFRYPAGPDAAPLIAWRNGISDADWIASGGLDDKAWVNEMKATFGLEIKLD